MVQLCLPFEPAQPDRLWLAYEAVGWGHWERWSEGRPVDVIWHPALSHREGCRCRRCRRWREEASH